MDNWHGKIDVAKMSRTFINLSTASFTTKTGFNYPQSKVHETHINGKTIIIIGIGSNDLCT